jgi:hypothetical protein
MTKLLAAALLVAFTVTVGTAASAAPAQINQRNATAVEIQATPSDSQKKPQKAAKKKPAEKKQTAKTNKTTKKKPAGA